MAYQIDLTRDANRDLDYYTAFERRAIASEIQAQLTNEPSVETRNRKRLRDNPIDSWELRVGKHRVFYDVDEPLQTVTIVSVGHKEHNRLFVRGKQVQM